MQIYDPPKRLGAENARNVDKEAGLRATTQRERGRGGGRAHHLGGGVEVGFPAPQQPPPLPRKLRQEVLRARPGLQLVRPPLPADQHRFFQLQYEGRTPLVCAAI